MISTVKFFSPKEPGGFPDGGSSEFEPLPSGMLRWRGSDQFSPLLLRRPGPFWPQRTLMLPSLPSRRLMNRRV